MEEKSMGEKPERKSRKGVEYRFISIRGKKALQREKH